MAYPRNNLPMTQEMREWLIAFRQRLWDHQGSQGIEVAEGVICLGNLTAPFLRDEIKSMRRYHQLGRLLEPYRGHPDTSPTIPR